MRGTLIAMGLLGALRCESGNESVDGLETVAKFEAARLASYCGQLAGCCNADGSELDAESCQATLGTYTGILDRPTLRYDAQRAKGCIDAYAGWLDGCVPVGAEAIPSACQDVVVGTARRGGSCTDDRDCAPVGDERSRCHIEQDVVPPVAPYCELDATRSIREHLSAGAACSGQCMKVPSGDLCPGAADEPMCFVRDGLQCKDGACAALDPDGSSCRVDWLCLSGHCFFENPATGIGVCRTPVERDPCRQDSDCPSEQYCRTLPSDVDDARAGARLAQCEPRLAAAESCSENRECSSNNCGRDGLCRGDPSIPACAMLSVYPFWP